MHQTRCDLPFQCTTKLFVLQSVNLTISAVKLNLIVWVANKETKKISCMSLRSQSVPFSYSNNLPALEFKLTVAVVNVTALFTTVAVMGSKSSCPSLAGKQLVDVIVADIVSQVLQA